MFNWAARIRKLWPKLPCWFRKTDTRNSISTVMLVDLKSGSETTDLYPREDSHSLISLFFLFFFFFFYSTRNTTVGCPSPRVQKGAFGAVLMKSPPLVVEIINTIIKAGVTIPITVKCRIGVDDLDSYEYFHDFVGHSPAFFRQHR